MGNPQGDHGVLPGVAGGSGTGAGATGGANAIGELFAGHKATGETREAIAEAIRGGRLALQGIKVAAAGGRVG